jgi:ribosomal protein S14
MFKQDKCSRSLFKKKEIDLIIFKYIIRNQIKNYSKVLLKLNQFTYFNQSAQFAKIKNFCSFSKRSRSVLKKNRLSRIYFKKFVNKLYITGFKKSSW